MKSVAESSGATRRRLAVVAGLSAALAFAAALVPGCYGRNCDASYDTWGDGPLEGRMTGPDTWESNPVEGAWLSFPGARTWFFRVPDVATRRVKAITPYLSGSDAPQDAGQNYTLGSGNSVLIFPYADFFSIANGSCADYGLRVMVEFYPGGDAGADGGAEAGPSDASTDAPSADGASQ